MAHSKFPLEILTPEGKIFEGEVEMVSTRTSVGSIGVLANHQPLLAMLEPAELRVYQGENDILRFAQGEGYIQMHGNSALILVEDAVAPEDLDLSELEQKLTAAKERAEAAEPGSEARRAAEADVRRCEAFIAVAQGGGS